MKPLLSIVIPTKDRYEYLTPLVELIIGFRNYDIELIIQDNSENRSSDFLEEINKIKDARIKYFYEAKSLSVVENCDKAVLNSTGKYVSLLGDDDGIIPELIEYVEKMKDSNIDVLLPEKALYSWPDITTSKVMSHAGQLTFKLIDERIIEIDPTKELLKCLRGGCAELHLMPRIYHAIVSRVMLDKVYQLTGSFFPGPSPDMANAVALSVLKPKTYYIKMPLIISGHGYKSTGGAGKRGKHFGDLGKIKHLPKDTEENWENIIPKIWTGPTIYAESAIKALRRTNNDSFIKLFNVNKMKGTLAGSSMKLLYITLKCTKTYDLPLIVFYLLMFIAKRSSFFVRNLVRSKLNVSVSDFSFQNVRNIQEAVKIINERLKA